VAFKGEISVQKLVKDGEEQWTWQFAGSTDQVVATGAQVYKSRAALDEALAVARAELADAKVVERDPRSGGEVVDEAERLRREIAKLQADLDAAEAQDRPAG